MISKITKIKSFLLFCISGDFGFLCDTGIFYFFSIFVNSYLGRLCSFLITVFLMWLINRNITFKTKKNSSYLIEFIAYLKLMIFGGMTNLITFFTATAYIKLAGVFYDSNCSRKHGWDDV